VVGEASVDCIPALLTIDTGSIHSLLLNSSFVKEHDLVHRYSATVRGYAGVGYEKSRHWLLHSCEQRAAFQPDREATRSREVR
jgi:hypothetical protein